MKSVANESHLPRNGATSRRYAPASRGPKEAAVSATECDSTAAVPSSKGCAMGNSGCSQSSPYRASGIVLKTGEPIPSGWTAEQGSWRNPGRVSSSVRAPPPTVSLASNTDTENPRLASSTAAVSPLGPAPTTTASSIDVTFGSSVSSVSHRPGTPGYSRAPTARERVRSATMNAHADRPVEASMEEVIGAMAARLTGVRGVRAVSLGGSRARGAERPGSDWDLGVYYRGTPDVAALTALAAEVAEGPAGSPVEVAGPGGWGPWVNGGSWLTVDGVAVDWILRDLDRVERVWTDCREGRYEVGIQPGHPLGFWSPAYAGEVALCRVLADPYGELTRLRAETADYPEPLRTALAGAVWEAEFSVAAARKTLGREGGAAW